MKKEEALIRAKEDTEYFLSENSEWNGNKDVVMAAVQQNGYSLQYASKELRNNKEVVSAAVQKDGMALKYVYDELRGDKEIVMTAVQQWCSYALRYASDNLKNDKEVVLAAVRQEESALYYASNELRKDKSFILQATQINKYACQHSLLNGYKRFNAIVKKEGINFLFSCWNNESWEIRLQVAKHHNFLPTVKQIESGLKDKCKEVQQVYQLRQDEWLSKMEENKLRNTI